MCSAVPVLDWQCWFPSKTKGPNTVHGLNSWCLDDRVGLKVLSICFFRFQGQTMPRWPAFVASAHCQFVIIKTINWICLVLDTELIANIFSGKIICLWSWTPNSAACQGRVNHLVGSRNQPHCPYRIDGPLPLCRQTLSLRLLSKILRRSMAKRRWDTFSQALTLAEGPLFVPKMGVDL